MITIRRVPSLEHNFQLVVTKVYEEGDQELLEDEDESELLRPDQSLNFHSSIMEQLTKKGRSLSVRNSSSEQAQLTMNLPLFGAISMATSMNSLSLLLSEQTNPPRPSLKLACTALCMKGSTSEVRSRRRMPI